MAACYGKSTTLIESLLYYIWLNYIRKLQTTISKDYGDIMYVLQEGRVIKPDEAEVEYMKEETVPDLDEPRGTAMNYMEAKVMLGHCFIFSLYQPKKNEEVRTY